MSNSKLTLYVIISMIMATMSCSSMTDSKESGMISGPEWLRKPPHSEEFIYGIGSASDEATAKQKSMVNAAQQFSTHVKSVFLIQEQGGGEALKSFDQQISEYTLKGAKYVEKYVDEDNQVWVLTEAPLNCLLDGTENILITYLLSSKPELKSELLSKPENNGSISVDAIKEYRSSMRQEISNDAMKMIDSETVTEKIIEKGYVDPGYAIAYHTNGTEKARPPVDSTIYHRNDYAYVLASPVYLNNEFEKPWRWDSKADGTGVSYQPGSIMKIEDRNRILYAIYDDIIPKKSGYMQNYIVHPHPGTIVVDGKMDDWIDISSVHSDMLKDMMTEERDDADIAAIYYAIDDNFFYIMVRTAEIPMKTTNMAYYFNLKSPLKGGVMYFDLFDKNSSSKYAHYNEGYGTDSTEWSAMHTKMKVESGDVLEIALPLDVLKESDLYSNEMRLYMINRIRSSQLDSDDIQSEIFFP